MLKHNIAILLSLVIIYSAAYSSDTLPKTEDDKALHSQDVIQQQLADIKKLEKLKAELNKIATEKGYEDRLFQFDAVIDEPSEVSQRNLRAEKIIQDIKNAKSMKDILLGIRDLATQKGYGEREIQILNELLQLEKTFYQIPDTERDILNMLRNLQGNKDPARYQALRGLVEKISPKTLASLEQEFQREMTTNKNEEEISNAAIKAGFSKGTQSLLTAMVQQNLHFPRETRVKLIKQFLDNAERENNQKVKSVYLYYFIKYMTGNAREGMPEQQQRLADLKEALSQKGHALGFTDNEGAILDRLNKSVATFKSPEEQEKVLLYIINTLNKLTPATTHEKQIVGSQLIEKLKLLPQDWSRNMNQLLF